MIYIIGSGFSGLTTAYALNKKGIKSTVISPGDRALKSEGIDGQEIPTPNADKLREVIELLNYKEKNDQLTNRDGGTDINPEIANVTISILQSIAQILPGVNIKVTAGNDVFHKSGRHHDGRAIDFVVESVSEPIYLSLPSILQPENIVKYTYEEFPISSSNFSNSSR